MYQRNVIPKLKVLAALKNAVAPEFANLSLFLSLWFEWSYVTGANTKLHSDVPAATYRHDPSWTDGMLGLWNSRAAGNLAKLAYYYVTLQAGGRLLLAKQMIWWQK